MIVKEDRMNEYFNGYENAIADVQEIMEKEAGKLSFIGKRIKTFAPGMALGAAGGIGLGAGLNILERRTARKNIEYQDFLKWVQKKRPSVLTGKHPFAFGKAWQEYRRLQRKTRR